MTIGGDVGHRKYECPLLRNYTANIICRICGNAGHFARDCRERPPVGEFPRFNNNGGGYNNGKNETDQEYERLMLELTGNESANGTGTRAAIEDGGFSQSRSRSDYPSRPLPPPSSQPMPPRSSAPPPWARR